MAKIDVREVGPRDGLQSQPPVPVEDRVRLIGALADAGVQHIEACSFVSPKAVPSMAGAADVMAQVPRSAGVRYAALVPNVIGAEMALATNVDELTVTVSASETYNQKNVRRTIDESVAQASKALADVKDAVANDLLLLSKVEPVETILSALKDELELMSMSDAASGLDLASCANLIAAAAGVIAPGRGINLLLRAARGPAIDRKGAAAVG